MEELESVDSEEEGPLEEQHPSKDAQQILNPHYF